MAESWPPSSLGCTLRFRKVNCMSERIMVSGDICNGADGAGVSGGWRFD